MRHFDGTHPLSVLALSLGRVRPGLSRWVRAAAAGWLVLAAIGCGAPDRSGQVRQLRDDIAKMPGVESVDPGYTNDFENGSELNLVVAMPTATEDQIVAVASRINTIKGRDFTDYRQLTKFIVGDGLEVKCGAELNTRQIADDTHRLRLIRGGVPRGRIEWSRGGALPRLEVWDVENTADVLTTVLASIGSEPMTVYIRSLEPTKFPTWEVSLPLNAQQRSQIDGLLSRVALPVYYVRVGDGRITQLSVYVADPATAYRDLKSVISAMAPTKEHPLELDWSRMVDPDNFHQFTGSVQIPGCPAGNGSPQTPQRQDYVAPEAAALQRQLQSEFNVCN
jgi:hypothetical protein